MWFASRGLHSVPSILCPLQSPLLHFSSSPSPSPFHVGALSCEMRSSILAEVLMVLEIELWTVDLHTPGPKMRPPIRILAVPRAASQNWALGRFCLLEHQALLHRRGFQIPFFSCSPPPPPPPPFYHFQPGELALTKFRKRE